jgi:uncharacterized protein YjbI with pentapeptide repeats
MFKKIRSFFHRITAEHVAWLLIGLGVLVAMVGFLPKPLPQIIEDFYANFATELISIGVVVLIIDSIRESRANEREKRMLTSQMASQFNILACDAARILRDRGWHKELNDISLWKANLESAVLYEFNLARANLTYANLKDATLNSAILDGVELVQGESGSLEGAHLHRASLVEAHIGSEKPDYLIFKNAHFFETDLSGANFLGIFNGIMTESFHSHLQAAYSLRGSIMPDGKRYAGRYNLPGDLVVASNSRDTNDPQAMAEFYGVTLEEYQQGQTWRVQYTKYLRTLERKARSLCAKKGFDWDRMNADLRGKFVDTFLKEP